MLAESGIARKVLAFRDAAAHEAYLRENFAAIAAAYFLSDLAEIHERAEAEAKAARRKHDAGLEHAAGIVAARAQRRMKALRKARR
jgi:hypothetical protein